MEERVPQGERFLPLMHRLRLLSAVGIAGVVAGVLVQLVGEYLGPRIPAGMAGGQVMTLPIAWVPLASLLLLIAWSYLLVGGFHGPLWLRFAIGAAWTVLAIPFLQVGGLWAAPGALGVLVLLVWRGWARPLEDFGWRESLVFGLTAGATFLGALVASLLEPDLPLFTYITALGSQLTVFTLIATPLLVLAGLDLAAVAGGAGGWVRRQLQGWAPQNLAILVGTLALVQAGYLLLGGVDLTPGFGLTLLALVLLLGLSQRLPAGQFLAEPPFSLLVALLLLALAAPLGGALAVMAGFDLALYGFLGSAVLALLASLALRPLLERRWPGAGVALPVVALWLAWLLAGGSAPEWAPSSRALQMGIAAVALGMALLARRPAVAKRLPLVLEVLVVLTVISGIESAYSHDLDAGDLFTFIQVTVMVGSSLWVLLRRRGWWRLVSLGALGAAVLAVALNPALLDASQGITNLALMALALIWGIVAAHKRMGELLGAGTVQVHLTFLLIGFSLMTVAVLGWNRSLSPAPEDLTDFGFLAQFGLVAMGVPLYLLGGAQRSRG